MPSGKKRKKKKMNTHKRKKRLRANRHKKKDKQFLKQLNQFVILYKKEQFDLWLIIKIV